MSTLAAELIAAQHPGGGAHLVILAGVAVVGLALFGVKRWRSKRDARHESEPE
jgi:hypothetical protein